MASPYPFLDLNALQQLISCTGKDLAFLWGLNQRVSQQIQDLDRQTALRPEVIERRQSEARQRAMAEADAREKLV